MEEESKVLTIGERLRNGEKIFCNSCKEGFFITDIQDISKSHGFYCNVCNAMINIDPIIDIE